MDLFAVLPAGGIIGTGTPEFGIADLPRPFVAPTLREVAGPSGARVTLVSARGATGKSVLAKRLSGMKQAPLWRLDADKTVSGHALEAKLNAYLGPNGMASFRADDDALIIVDALDEARMRVSGLSWVEFLDSLVQISDTGRRLALFGRERILEDVWMHFDDAGIACAWYEISHFDAEQRVAYVNEGVATRGKSASGGVYEQARDAVLDALAGTVEHDLSDAFVGYAPVLDAVVALLASSNHMNVINDFAQEARAAERVIVLMDILKSLLAREQAKTTATVAELGLDPSSAYRSTEQLAWLASDLMDAQEPPLEWCPPQSRPEYIGRVREFLRDHPFRSENRWASPVFSAFVAAERFGDQQIRDALHTVGAQTGLLFDFVAAKDADTLIDEWQFAALHASMLAAEWQAVEAVVSIEPGSSASEVSSVGGDLLLFEERTSRGFRFELVLERDNELRLFGPTAFLSADFPGRVEITSPTGSISLGPDCYVRCRELRLRGDTLEIARRAHVPGEASGGEPSVVLDVSAGMVADAQLAGHPSQDAFELRVPPAHVLAYPWRNYRGEWQAPTERPNERAVRFLNMMMNLLRNHGHTGLMAVFEKKLEGRQSIKQAQFASVISELEASGVVRQQGGLIFLQPSWVPHRYSGKARDGLPTLDDQYEHWAPVLDRISAVLDSTSEGA